MSTPIEELLQRIRALQEELETEFHQRREALGVVVERGRVRFAQEVLSRQKLQRVGLLLYIWRSRLLVVLTAPVIYSVFIPFVLMDLFVTVYQWVCFPVYGIPRVRRSDYLVFDRGDLKYLNAIEKLNCAYCAYGNGIAAYTREVSARTEQYWCPIKHARRVVAAHERYPDFFEYGDAEAFRKGLDRLRRQYGESAWVETTGGKALPPAGG